MYCTMDTGKQTRGGRGGQRGRGGGQRGRGGGQGGQGGGQGGQGGRGSPSTTRTRSDKTVMNLNLQRIERAKVILPLIEPAGNGRGSSVLVKSIKANSITRNGYKFFVKNSSRKRSICSYNYQVFQIAETLLREHRGLQIPKYRNIYECLGRMLLACTLDRVYTIFLTEEHLLNAEHQSMVVILSGYASIIFNELSSFSNVKNAERYRRLAALAHNLKYLSSLNNENVINRNPVPDPILVNHIKKYVLLLKENLIQAKLFEKVGVTKNNSMDCPDLRTLLNKINIRRNQLLAAKQRASHAGNYLTI